MDSEWHTLHNCGAVLTRGFQKSDEVDFIAAVRSVLKVILFQLFLDLLSTVPSLDFHCAQVLPSRFPAILLKPGLLRPLSNDFARTLKRNRMFSEFVDEFLVCIQRSMIRGQDFWNRGHFPCR